MQKSLLNWYDKNKRLMPWRALPGQRPDPYAVWLSEIMLQQTTVVAVVPYFNKFMARWPRVQDLARAHVDEVLAMWAGLGYYARARNLHKCAQKIVAEYQGCFPSDTNSLLGLPGVGPYTAAAIRSIAFDLPAVAVDGNVERVVSRLFALRQPVAVIKKKIAEKANEIANGVTRPGDFTQAFMELGATVCTPRQPKCDQCPWSRECLAFQKGIAAELPVKAVKKKKPLRREAALWIENKKVQFLIEKRPNKDKGLFAGMYQLPSVTGDKHSSLKKKGQVRHVFTHFDLILEIFEGKKIKATAEQKWISWDEVERYALPSLMQKAIKLCKRIK